MEKFPIGITGRNKAGGVAGAGKDLFTSFLVSNYPQTFIKYSFADPMRDIAQIFGFKVNQLLDPVLKEKEDEFWKITPRKFMQIMGTDMFRDVWRDDVWIKCAEKFIIDHPVAHVVIPDVRFKNEFKFIQNNGGLVIQIRRDNAPTSVHVSELEVNECIDKGELKPDIIIDNNGTEWDLHRKAEQFYLERIGG